ncbi:SsgA family sporulation/cell division regulator [Kitasatospora sp. McL0602]|uniref:SsgA family sporulation/cell division regulator n=1 Tax=Kitasatospora sp. McL0602 TaxID=3439530 RepID=UPI003F8B6B3A
MNDAAGARVPAQRTSAGGCVVHLRLWVTVAPGVSAAMDARLRYTPADPYAVFLDCHVGQGAPITWMFARDLLAEGLGGWSGAGRVCVRPAVDEATRAVVISLTGEGSTVHLHAPRAPVAGFLARTGQLVPFGEEDRHLDLDTLLERLRTSGLPEPEP